MDPFVFAAHQFDQLFVYDFNDLLRRHQAFQNFSTDTAFLHICNKVFDNFEIHIRFQKR